MPIYEYKCSECGKTLDFLAKRLSDRPGACPECGGSTLKKQFSTFSSRVGNGAEATRPTCSPTGTCCPTGACSLG